MSRLSWNWSLQWLACDIHYPIEVLQKSFEGFGSLRMKVGSQPRPFIPSLSPQSASFLVGTSDVAYIVDDRFVYQGGFYSFSMVSCVLGADYE
jgi:hypothetical protein